MEAKRGRSLERSGGTGHGGALHIRRRKFYHWKGINATRTKRGGMDICPLLAQKVLALVVILGDTGILN